MQPDSDLAIRAEIGDAGSPSSGSAPVVWTTALECYLAELSVAPTRVQERESGSGGPVTCFYEREL